VISWGHAMQKESCISVSFTSFICKILSHLSGHVGRVRRLEHTDTTHFAGGLHLFCRSDSSDSSGCCASNDQKHGKAFACLGDQCLQCIIINQLLSIAECVNLVQLPHVLPSKMTFICAAALLTACKPIQASLGAHAGVSST